MMDIRERGTAGIFEVRAADFISAAEYDAAFEQIALVSRTRPEPLRLIMGLSDLSGFETSALWCDSWVDLGHPDERARIAVVAGQDLYDWALTLLAPFGQAEIRVFPPQHEAAAHRWLAEPHVRKPLVPESVALCRGCKWTRLFEDRMAATSGAPGMYGAVQGAATPG